MRPPFPLISKIMKTFVGIDPGAKGFITAIFPDGRMKFAAIADMSEQELFLFLRSIKDMSEQVTAVMEDVHPLFGSSAKSTFSFGEIKGLLRGLLIAGKIPYTLVPPKTWQKEIWTTPDVVSSTETVRRKNGDVKVKRIDTKATSINAARRLFPEVDLRKSERSKKPDDNKVDSMLMAEYARRRNL